jgi:probable non-F420 flavinoid oxidoreductase
MTLASRIGYHASHEQFPPADLIKYVQAAERAGFARAMCSDHLMPWCESQGHSGFAWAWLGAALQATSLPFGVVNAPGYRYHPVVIAHASATLAQMFPGRFWIAIGSGEALNEHITGEPWPPKAERNQRLLECANIMRALWRGEMVTHRGHVTAIEAKLYSLPAEPPRLVGAAMTEETAGWMAGWADALITAGQPREKMQRILEAWRTGGGADKPIILQQKVSYAASHELALREAHEQWRANVFASSALAELRLPSQFEAVAQRVSPEEVAQSVRVSSDLAQHRAWIEEDATLGFDEIYIHNVNTQQTRFIEAFGEHVLPQLG